MSLPGIREVSTFLTFQFSEVLHSTEAEPYARFMQHKLWHYLVLRGKEKEKLLPAE